MAPVDGPTGPKGAARSRRVWETEARMHRSRCRHSRDLQSHLSGSQQVEMPPDTGANPWPALGTTGLEAGPCMSHLLKAPGRACPGPCTLRGPSCPCSPSAPGTCSGHRGQGLLGTPGSPSQGAPRRSSHITETHHQLSCCRKTPSSQRTLCNALGSVSRRITHQPLLASCHPTVPASLTSRLRRVPGTEARSG